VKAPLSWPNNSLSNRALGIAAQLRVRITVHQRNAGRLALSEKVHAVLARQSHILQVKNDTTISPLRADQRFQLGNVLFVDPAA
jgi:hypothetical protein